MIKLRRSRREQTDEVASGVGSFSGAQSQTIKSTAKEYDVVKIKAKLEELERLVEVELREGNQET